MHDETYEQSPSVDCTISLQVLIHMGFEGTSLYDDRDDTHARQFTKWGVRWCFFFG